MKMFCSYLSFRQKIITVHVTAIVITKGAAFKNHGISRVFEAQSCISIRKTQRARHMHKTITDSFVRTAMFLSISFCALLLSAYCPARFIAAKAAVHAIITAHCIAGMLKPMSGLLLYASKSCGCRRCKKQNPPH